ncbi:MAG: amidase [Burkholderiaceae bacterium]
MSPEALAWADAATLSEGLARGQYSALELTQACLERATRLQPRFHAYARLTPELALSQARASDARRAQGKTLGPLDGLPLALKDLCWTQGIATQAGMPIHGQFVPQQDGTVTRRLADAGLVLIGKAQMTEGAYSAHHPDIQAPINPWGEGLWTGVSSSGSGVALAAGLTCLAVGTDTGGSIRFPCAALGLTGLKPTWGRVSRFGAFELAASLDHIGPMARTALDCAWMLQAMAGPDPLDPTAVQAALPQPPSLRAGSLRGLRIGIDERHCFEISDPEIEAAMTEALKVFTALGAEVHAVRMPQTDALVEGWEAYCGVEAAIAHEQTFPSRREAYGPMLAGLLDKGRALDGLRMQQTLLERMRVKGALDALLSEVDVLAVPGMPLAAPSLERIAGLRQQPGYRQRLSRFTVPTDFSGHPTVSFPCGSTQAGLPVGMQLIGGALQEARLLKAVQAFQEACDWHRRSAPLEN